MQNSEIEAIALNPGPSLTYLTGLHFHLMERPVVAFFTPDMPPSFVLPELEVGKTSGDLLNRPLAHIPKIHKPGPGSSGKQ